MTITNSKGLKAKILEAFDAALDGDDPKPQVITAAVTYLKAFPPDEAPDGETLSEEQQAIVDQYAGKNITAFKR